MELQAIIDALRKDYIDPLANQFPLPFEPSQIDLANRKINWRPGQKEKLANDSVSFAAGNSPAMMLSALKHLPETEFSKAHALAQKNAALPIEQGGLGLHPDNTAMERARALGFDTKTYHGEAANVANRLESVSDNGGKAEQGRLFMTDTPGLANQYAGRGGVVYPLMIRSSDLHHSGFDMPSNDVIEKMAPEEISKLLKDIDAYNARIDKGHLVNNGIRAADAAGKNNVIFHQIIDTPGYDPLREWPVDVYASKGGVRSRFAAFDPLKKNSANILASALLGVGLARGEDK